MTDQSKGGQVMTAQAMTAQAMTSVVIIVVPGGVVLRCCIALVKAAVL